MTAAMDAVQSARRQVRIAACRVAAAELGLAEDGWPSLAEAEEALDAAAATLAAAKEELTTERRQAGGLLI